jgi:hypothetical protein
MKACQKYRSALPGYLVSAQEEMKIADEIMEKLRQIQSD